MAGVNQFLLNSTLSGNSKDVSEWCVSCGMSKNDTSDIWVLSTHSS